MPQIFLSAIVLAAAATAAGQSANPDALLMTDALANVCAAHSPQMSGLPARLLSELSPDQRAVLAKAKAAHDGAQTSAEITGALASLSSEKKDAACADLMSAMPGGMYLYVLGDGVLNELLSEYPAVVDRGVADFKTLPAQQREKIATNLASGLAEPDDILRSRMSGALQKLGPDANLALPEIERIILSSAKGLPPTTRTVAVNPELHSGTMSSNSATVSFDASEDIVTAAFAVLAGLKPVPVNTFCHLMTVPNKKVTSRASDLLHQLAPGTVCPPRQPK